MMCNHHPNDFTSAIGVCATCLRHRLLKLVDEQTRLEEALDLAKQIANSYPKDRRCKLKDPHSPKLLFPRSVSPYVDSRPSNDHKNLHQFFSTPQVGPAYDAACGFGVAEKTKKNKSKFVFFKNLFRSRSRSSNYNSDRSDWSNLDQKFPVSPYGDSSSSFWLSFLPIRRKKKPATEKTPARGNCRRPNYQISNRGMSPDDCFDTGYSSECSSHGPRRTPLMAVTPLRQKRQGHSKSISGLAFCLSPLVRASPGRQWSQKGSLKPELGEVRIMGNPYLSTVLSCNGNRSRKLVDIGRVNPSRPGCYDS